MGKQEIHRKDANQDALIEFLEAHGVSIERIGRPVDLLASYHGITAAIEVKMPKGKLEPAQVKFFARFQGLARVLRSEADAKELLQVMKAQAGQITKM